MSALQLRRLVLGMGLVGAAALAIWGDKSPSDGLTSVKATRPVLTNDVNQAAPPASMNARSGPADAQQVLLRRDQLLPRADDARVPVDLFAEHQPATEPATKVATNRAAGALAKQPPVVVRAVENAPMVNPESVAPAPPPPFTYIGKQRQQGGPWVVFLLSGNEVVLAREGEVLAGKYAVDRVTPPTLRLTDLQTKVPMQIDIGEPG